MYGEITDCQLTPPTPWDFDLFEEIFSFLDSERVFSKVPFPAHNYFFLGQLPFFIICIPLWLVGQFWRLGILHVVISVIWT